MNKILSLAIKDLRVLISDRGNVFWVFGFPVIFALFFGAIYSGAGEGPSGMEIAVVDEDNSDFSNSYISKLQSDEALKIINLSRDEAIEQVRKGKVAAAVILKKGIGDGFEALFSSEEQKLEIASDPSRKMESGYLQGLLAKAQFEALSEKFTDRHLFQIVNPEQSLNPEVINQMTHKILIAFIRAYFSKVYIEACYYEQKLSKHT